MGRGDYFGEPALRHTDHTRHRTGPWDRSHTHVQHVVTAHSYTTIVLDDGDGAGPARAVVGKIRKPILDARACNQG